MQGPCTDITTTHDPTLEDIYLYVLRGRTQEFNIQGRSVPRSRHTAGIVHNTDTKFL